MYQPSLPLTLQNADSALTEGLGAMESGETGFDLATTEATDSGAVAILLAWQRAAKARGVKLVFHNPSPALTSLAELYGVAELLNISQDISQRH